MVVERAADLVIVECSGVGYGLSVSLATMSRLPLDEREVTLRVTTVVTQDNIRLYGFLTREEQTCFVKLTATTGVGPKLALAILSALSPRELREVVARGDREILTRIPGVGRKKAERLLLELKDRIGDGEVLPDGAIDSLGDLVQALISLGFRDAEALQAARETIDRQAGETDLAVLVKGALRATTVNR